MTDLENQESWEEAKHIASLLGQLPGSFSSCIRFLRTDAEQNGNQLGEASRYNMSRFLKSRSFLVPLYFCAKTFRAEQLQSYDKISAGTLLKVFKPDELSYLIGLLYIFRRIKKGCDPIEWSNQANSINCLGEIGGYVGQAIPAIGFIRGLIASAFRATAMGMFLGIDKSGYLDYKKALRREKAPFNLQYEMTRWKCTHAQVACVLMQMLGLGRSRSFALVKAMHLPPGKLPDPSDEDSYAVAAGTQWAQSLLDTGKPPEVVYGAKFYPLASELTTLLARVGTVKENGSENYWLSRGKTNATEEIEAMISSGSESHAPAAAAPHSPVIAEHIPEDLTDLEKDDE